MSAAWTNIWGLDPSSDGDSAGHTGSHAARRARLVPGRELDHHVGPDHLHGAAGVLHLADAAADAADQAAADQAAVGVLDRLGRRRGLRRGEGGAGRGRRVPARPEALRRGRRAGPEGDHAPRAARHRQDAARQGGRARVGGAVLQPVRGLVRRDVRRPRRGADPAPVLRGARAPPGDHLHRRARRRRRAPRLRPELRARADAQPAARRDGRLRLDRRPRRDRGLEPAREARPRAAAAGPLRPPDPRLPARRRRARGDPARPLAQQAARRRRRPGHARPPDVRPRRRRPGQHLQRGGDLRRPRRTAPSCATRTSTPPSSASSPACSRAAR